MDIALLTLGPEFGGTAFGPFPAGNVALGSDAQQCHIALSPALGLDPVAAWVTLQADGVHWLQPTRMGGGVFLVRPGGHPQELTGAVQLRFGDSFMVGGAQGPRFVLQPAPQLSHGSTGSGPGINHPTLGGRRAPTAGDMGRELQRQASTKAMTVGPLAELSKLAYRLKSGALLQPRYLVAGVIALLGMAAAGCAGLLATLHRFI